MSAPSGVIPSQDCRSSISSPVAIRVTLTALPINRRHASSGASSMRSRAPSFSGRFGANLTDNFDIGVVTRYLDTSLRFTGDDVLGPESLKSTEADEQLFTRGTAHLVSFDGVLDQTVGLAYTKFNQRDFNPNPSSAVASFFNGDRLKADCQADVKLMPGQILTFRAEHQRDEITTPIAEITDDAGMVQLQSSIGERFFNAVSVRYDSYDTFGAQPTFRIAPALLIPETDSKLKGSVGTGFKPPP
jgi:vitamin B12 transporter